jgi:acyl-[acyl-carrier-protein]-phospholipid O-acyltransferase/long-chain-fatty-acid--[acyl-carrier-protein] ligase
MIGLLRFLLRLLFGFRVYNERALQTPGPVLLVPNHLSWLDWLWVGLCLQDDWKFVVSSTTAQKSWVHRKIMLNRRTFPIDTLSPYAVKRMAEFLQRQGRLVLFAEGRLSHTGSLQKLFDGTGFLLHKTAAKVIPCHIRGAERLPFSPNPLVKRLFPRVSVHFGEVLTPPKMHDLSTAQARVRLTSWLRDQLVRLQFDAEMTCGARSVPEAIFDMARWRPRFRVLQDVNQTLTYRRLLLGATLLGGQFQRAIGVASERVGVLLPNVNATPVALCGLWAAGKIPAMLNYSAGVPTLLACAQLAGLKHVVTSRAFLARAKLKADVFLEAGLQVLYVEDVRASISALAKLRAAGRVRLAPRTALGCGRTAADTAVILFTSGSEGVPKGVELTHGNILANVRQMAAVSDLNDQDRVFNALPLFHSFGLTGGLVLPLVRGFAVFLYPSPLHYRVVPTVFYLSDSTIFLATNTFLNGYARKAHPLDFRSLRYLFAGAEKIQESTMTTWARQFGARVLEGYGATECSPAISVNTPLIFRYGTAGRLLPGLEFRLEPLEGVAEGGRLFVRGPNVMRGYLNPEANATFKACDGWYDTGDIARVDEEGYVTILGRLKRFAKISGEMVSLTAVEDALAGAFPQYGLRCQVAVLSRPDADKGEALLAVTNEPRLQLDEVRGALRARGLSNLCVPREVRFVREIPKLGTGKVDHRALAKLV